MYQKVALESKKNEITVRAGLKKQLSKHKGIVHLVFIATKPDIIKQAPIIIELIKNNEFVVVGHTNQHYDWDLSQSYLEEFGIVPDFNLNIRGNIADKHSQLIFRLSKVLQMFKKQNITLVPYPYADTTTASGAAMACYLNRFPVAHIEAGLRTMMPEKKIFNGLLKNKKFDVWDYYHSLKKGEWEKGSFEPFPEQFNTRASAPCSALHFAPTQLNHQHLINEGYYKDTIYTVGNTISDAIKFIKHTGYESEFLAEHPQLLDDKLIRVCIHRRENLGSLHRFKVIMDSIERLAKEGTPLLFIALRGTEAALINYKLYNKIKALDKKYRNFVYSKVLPYREAVATLEKCALVVTDSGGIQEESNIMHIPCATARFNSDRPESIMEGSNILAPPITSDIFYRIILEASENNKLNKKMRRSKNLYGEKVSKKIVKIVKGVAERENLMRFEEDRLGFSKMDFWKKGSMEW